MDLSLEPRPVLSVCLHTAWQKTLSFGTLAVGGVNRACSCHEAGGGKGVNVARVFRLLGLPVGLAGFAGGWSGDCLRGELARIGVEDLTVSCASPTRCCYTVIDGEHGQATELIEPSGEIGEGEYAALMELLERRLPAFGCVAICGSMAPGIPRDAYGRITSLARRHGIPVVLDAVRQLDGALSTGVRLLKINGDELRQLTGCAEEEDGCELLLNRYEGLKWLAVTHGSEPAFLCSRLGSWRIILPRLDRLVSPIGAGDCATAIMTRRIAEGWDGDIRMPEALAEALACASASCLTDTPSVFDRSVAEGILKDCVIERCRRSSGRAHPEALGCVAAPSGEACDIAAHEVLQQHEP